MSGSVVATEHDTAAAVERIDRFARAPLELRTLPGSPRPVLHPHAAPLDGVKHEHRHGAHHHAHHGDHNHRVRWRSRPKWPAHLKRSMAAATICTALLSWFWMLIGSCEPAFMVP